MESYNADLEVHWAYDKFLALRESDCAATPELSEQQQMCLEAYKDFVDVERSKADWHKRRAIYKLATLFAGGLTAIATVLMPASKVAQLADLTVWTANNVQDVVTLSIIITTNWSEERGHEKVNRLCEPPDCGSSPGKSPEQDPPTRTPSVPAPTNPVIDPSGYAYEAVASNRVEGVTATIYYRDGANAVPWEDASLYDQVSEQTTGADGRYEWMTPPGDWLVKLSKEGYAPADSTGDSAAVNGWLPVPPPQMNVNIAMTADAAPEVRGAWIGADRARVVFSQYMTMDSADAVTVTKNGDPVSVNAAFADREESPTQPGVYYGRVLELYGDFAGDGYAVSVTTAARNYAGTPLAAAYESGSLSVGRMVGALTHAYPNRFVTDVGDTETLVIAVSDTEKRPIANVPVTVRQGDGGMLRFAETAVNSDVNGNAVFTVTGIAAGSNELTFTAADAVSVTMNTRVKPLGTESPKKPTANLSDRQTVEAGTALTLSCATEDAVIYYTTDDTCPCTESENRQVYTGPIPVMRTTLFRVASWTASGGYSERLNLRVVVDHPAPTVTLTQDGLTVSDLSEGVVPVAGYYNAAGQLVGAAYLTDGTLHWDAQPERVCVFFLDENGRPLYPAWHQAF